MSIFKTHSILSLWNISVQSSHTLVCRAVASLTSGRWRPWNPPFYAKDMGLYFLTNSSPQGQSPREVLDSERAGSSKQAESSHRWHPTWYWAQCHFYIKYHIANKGRWVPREVESHVFRSLNRLGSLFNRWKKIFCNCALDLMARL